MLFRNQQTKFMNPNSWVQNQIPVYTLGVFINLSKVFDTVNHFIIPKKSEIYGIREKKILNGLKVIQEIVSSIFELMTKIKQTFYQLHGVPQCSILAPLLFLLYVDDLPNASKILDPIMFTDDTNVSFSNCNIAGLLATVNSEFSKINQSFLALS